MREMRVHHQILPVLPGKALAHEWLRLDPVRVPRFTAVTSPQIQLFFDCLVSAPMIPIHPRNKGANWQREVKALNSLKIISDIRRI